MDTAIASVRALQPETLRLTAFERYVLKHVQDGL